MPTNIPSYLGLRLLKAALNVGDFRRAQKLYDNITQPDPATCSTLISAFTTRGLPNESIRLYALLRARGIETHSSVFLAIAKACGASGDALRVKEVHAYGKCKYIEGARQAFDDLVVKDVVSWIA